MSESQEEILANFQSITGIDDVGEAIYHLEESNWDLLTAVHRVLPQDNAALPVYVPSASEPMNNLDLVGGAHHDVLMTAPSSPHRTLHRNIFGAEPNEGTSGDDNSVEFAGELRDGSDVRNGAGPSSSSSAAASLSAKAKDIIFNIHHNYTTQQIKITDRATLGELKRKIHELTSIPVCRQSLRGWVQKSDDFTNSTRLASMQLARENELIVTDVVGDGGGALEDESIARLSNMYTLNILNEKEGVSIPLQFRGTQTILDIKTNVYTITNIAVRHQEWIGWPPDVTNETLLALTGIPVEHDLVLRSTEASAPTVAANASEASASGTRNASEPETIDVDTDSDTVEFEDASDFNAEDDLFTSPVVQNRVKNLIPDNTDSEIAGCTQFVENYIERYGQPHPNFFQGTLEEAVNEACHKPAKDRKLLAIYLHHDGSVLTNVFCDRLLKCDTIMQTLEHNFVLYGWDLTYESNKNLFLSSISACIGQTALITVRNTPVIRLPALVVIGKSRSACDVLSVIYGNVGVDELLNKLMDTIKLYSDQREVEIREENERAAREMVKMEQDVAYNESLEADRLKEEARQQKERAVATERRRLESERQEAEAIREANRLDAERCVPPEPEPTAEGITKIRVRKPNGEFLERRFTAESQLDILLKFVASKGYPIDEYKVISSWPRRDLTSLNAGDTLQQLNLCPQETVTLEER